MANQAQRFYAFSIRSFGEYNQTTRCIKQVIEAMQAGVIEPFYGNKIIRTMYYAECEAAQRAKDAEPPTD